MSRLLQLPEAASLGLHAAVILAENSQDKPVTVAELAQALDASEAHLSKVMQRLAKAGIVNSTRGPKGGFALGRPAASISLLEVYEAIEGPIEPARCVFGRPVCGRAACIFGGYVERFDRDFRECLAGATLGELVAQEEASDVRS